MKNDFTTMDRVILTECPRDAMQGIHDFIDTDLKSEYINLLLKANFDVLDFGSFVSPKAIPQMKDTAEVLGKLDLTNTETKLLAIIANRKGVQNALDFEEISYLGFPLSLSETFQQRNTNASISEAWKVIEEISNTLAKTKKELVVYLSMGFGNPYSDIWNEEIIYSFSNRLYNDFGITNIALSDTIGVATPQLIQNVFSNLTPVLGKVQLGAHLHVRKENTEEILESAYKGGCRKFDGAIKGFGGCPMAKDELVGNMSMERMLGWFENNAVKSNVDRSAFQDAFEFSSKLFL